MLAHERECIERKVGGSRVRWVTHNALAAPAGPELLVGMDAVVVGGSGDFSVHDARSRPWIDPIVRLVEAALELDVPGFGICFGHQILGEVMGGTVVHDADRSEVGTVTLELTEAGRADPLFAQLENAFRAHTGHTDRVLEVPDGLELLATNDTVATQAFRVRGAAFWSAQFHPDLTGAEARSRYLAYKAALDTPTAGHRGEGTECFEVGSDETSQLLTWFARRCEP